MEYHKDTVIVGIGEYVVVEAHCLLFVAAEEIDLYTADAVLLHPFHIVAAATMSFIMPRGP